LPACLTMGGMSAVVKWWSRLAAAVTGVTLTLIVPVHAWAAGNGVADVVDAQARYGRRRGGLGIVGFVGTLCCLFVVAAVVLVVMLVRRSRRPK
jgi:hypothetical protein